MGPSLAPAGATKRRDPGHRACRRLVVVAAMLAAASSVPAAAAARPEDVSTRAGDDAAFNRLMYSDKQWYGSTFWTGPDWTRVGRDWHHPGQETPSVRRFEAPRDGRVTVTGRVCKLHLAGDGIRASVRHNDREVWAAEIEGRDAAGQEPKLTLDVRRGDRIRFVVDKRQAIACDTTHWDPIVRYADGEEFRASAAFGQKQGAGGWFYEMLGGEPQPNPLAEEAVQRLADELIAIQPRSEPLGGRQCDPALLRMALEDWLRDDQINDQPGSYAGPAARHLQQAVDLLADLSGRGDEGPWATASRRLAELTAELARLQGSSSRSEDGPRPGAQEKARASGHERRASSQGHAPSPPAPLPQAREGRSSGQAQRTASAAAEPRRAASAEAWRSLYLRTRLLKREIALSNRLLNFGPLLVTKRVPPSWSHLVAQYFGWRQRPGGGIYVLEQPGYALACRDVLGGQLRAGSVLEPRLSYDARRIVFSFVALPEKSYQPHELPINELGGDEAYFHIYEIGVDGSGLRQLTQGPYDDMMPEYLPGGGIVFCSTRRQGYSRCFGPEYSQRWHSYTLHRMDAAGCNLRRLSFNDVSEWFPAVSNTGHVLFARWDYIDRDAVTHQNLWAARPDGTNPVAVWGNAAPKPHCTFQAKPIPHSNKIVFVASAHHAITGGPVCVLDPSVDANDQSAITRITPGPFPEAEKGPVPEYYESAWPLSERYFLVSYSAERLRFQGEHPKNPNPDNALGIYLLDAAENRELLYRDRQISTTTPIPLAARPAPPVLHDTIAPGAEPVGEMIVSDVYQGLDNVPRGAIRELRVVQIFPKTTYVANQPRIGLAGEENARAILGTVPVEADGSARFRLPAGRPVLFQALDAQGFARQTMRSTTYVQPGERTACIGCHEARSAAPPSGKLLALGRPASELKPGELGGRPFAFVEMVQPVLDRHCVRCHGDAKTEGKVDLSAAPENGFTKSYWSLCRLPEDWRNLSKREDWLPQALVPRFVQRNQIQVTPPGGQFSARGSRLMKLLCERPGHYEVRLSDGEVRRLAAWIDLNAVFYGVYDPDGQARQLLGQTVGMPEVQ